MQKSLLSFSLFLALLFLGNPLFTQVTSKGWFSKAHSVDSLAGFDEKYYRQIAVEEELSADAIEQFITLQKRVFIDLKYQLKAYFEEPIDPNSEEYKQKVKDQMLNPLIEGKHIGGGNVVNAAPCVNEGFELSNMTGWNYSAGVNVNSYAYPATPNVVTYPSSSLQIVTTPTTDPIIGAISNSPFSGNKVVKISDSSPNGRVQKIDQTFPVTSTNFLYEFAYQAISLQSPHTCSQQPYMRVVLKDFVGNILSCPNFTFATPNPTAVCSTTGITTWSLSGGVYRNPTWQKYSIDLTSYINSTITVEVFLSDCVPTGHYMYAYFDSNCSELGITLNGTTFISAPSVTVNVAAQCATTATLTAPSGLGPYLWNGPAGSGIISNTNQTISNTVAGDYTLSMNPPGSCLPIVRVIKLSFPPPTTITASPSSTICTSGSNTVTTLSAFGAASYTWQPGGQTLNIINVSPTVTTIYTLTARTGTCVGEYTFQVTVAPNPNLVVLSSNLSLCPGQTATLSASGANTYSWLPPNITGSLVTVTQTSTTTYTTIGTSTDGCISTATTAIVQTTLLPAAVIQIAGPVGTICPGTPVTYVALNASTFTWMPTGFVGNPAVLTPTATTAYTAIGSSGSCTNSAVFTVTVDPGPSMTVTSSPTIICPGGSATLSAVAPAALGFTWAPVASNASSIVVTPAAPTVYSVSGHNALGCISTYTVEPIISPLPSLTITPSSASICAGSSVGLTASGGTSYTWNPGALTGANISVSPSSNTTYTLTGANAVGCISTETVLVTVVNNPTVVPSANPVSICIGNSSTLSATGATGYTWSPGGLNGTPVTVSPTLTTTYTVSGSALGCTSSSTVLVTVLNGPTLNPVASPTAICLGASSNLSATGALGYTWNPGGSTAANLNVSPLVTTIYSVTGINAIGCLSTETVQVIVNPLPSLSVTASSASICAGGSISYTASGATNYTWNPGAFTGAILFDFPVNSTTYTLTGTNAFGCSSQTLVSVLVVPLPTVVPGANPPSICLGSSSTLSATGATNYTWNPGNLNGSPVTVSPITTTTYTVLGSAAGCSSSTTVVVSVLNGPTLNPVASPTAICPGFSSNLSASGALGYTWNPGGATGANINVSPAATTVYSVTGNNAIGCLTTQTVQVLVNPAPTVSISASSASICAGGSVVLTASGAGVYTWNPGGLGGLSATVTPSATTIYTLIGANGFGCLGTSTISILVVPIPTVVPSASPNPICIGFSSTLSAIGATGYTWNPGNINGSTAIVSPTINTNYTVSGSAAGCTGTAAITVSVQNGPTLNPVATPTAICPGFTSNLSASGATGYTWNPGGLSGSNVNVSPAATTIYTVTGASALGCLTSNTLQVVVNPTPSITISAAVPSICVGGFVGLTGGGAVSYTWLPGGSTLSAISPVINATTTFTLLGTSSLSCVGQNTITIIGVPFPTLVPVSTPTAICAGSSATLSVTGASTYSWFPGGATTQTLVVSPGSTSSYTVVGTASACSSSSVLTLVVNSIPSVTAFASPIAICPGFVSTLTASGASTYTWNPGNLTGASVTVSPLANTNYTVSGTSTAGCVNGSTVSVAVNAVPSLTVNVFSLSGSYLCSGTTATLNVTGASSATWNPGNLTGLSVTVTPMSTTIYTVTGANASGCLSQANTTLNVSPTPTLNAGASPTAVCIGNCSTLTATGANSYTWSSGSTNSTAVVCPSVTTVYSLVGATGTCSSNFTLSVQVNALPVLSVSASNASICSGASSTLTASGATSYTWLPGGSNSTSITVSPLSTSTYTLFGSNANGCSNSTVFTLNVFPTPSISISASNNTVCSASSLTLTAIGAGSYTWFPGSFTGSTLVQSPTVTTTYTVSGDLGACNSSTTLLVTVLPLPNITAVANPSAVCSGFSTTLTANGAATYTWLPMNTNGAVVTNQPVGPTTYTVNGLSASGCFNSATVGIIVVFPPTLSIAPSSTAICTGNSVTLTANGAASFTWQPGNQNTAAIVQSPTVTSSYTVNGDNGGCVGTQTIQIVVNPLPVVTASISNAVICAGGSVTLNAGGAVNYSWSPVSLSGATINDTPASSVTYTVLGQDANTCLNTATVGLLVNPNPTLSAVASATAVCENATVGLTANGAVNYTWSPIGLTGASVSDTPSLSITYTVLGEDANGCTGTETVAVQVIQNPTVIVSPQSSTICSGGTVTLTASGAAGFTWSPGGSNQTSIVESPTVTTTYTVDGDNAGLCFSSFTAQILVNPLPANVTASVSGIISCAGPTVDLFGASTDTNVSYFWSGPLNYTSNVQNPTAVNFWGNYTLTVTDNQTGCITTVTVDVPTDFSIPSVTLSSTSSSITCAIPQVTLNAANTTTNAGYVWSGPGVSSSTTQIITTTLQGVYTVTVTDLSSSCTGTASISIDTYTDVVITASIVPATCNGTVSNNNGTILAFNFGALDKFDLVSGSTYTGSATYITATGIPTTGIITNTLANPQTTVAYTVRFFDDKGCTKDTTLILTPTSCEINAFGLAKSIPSIITNDDGTYDVTVKTVVKNYGTVPLTEVNLEEDLNAVFASPMTFTVVAAPSIASGNSSLSLNSSFDGGLVTNLTNSAGSQIGVGVTDTILFTVRVTPFGRFGPFSNTIKGTANSSAVPSMTLVMADSSQNGMDPNPDADLNPMNNNEPTVFSFTPKLFFGLTKTGEAIKSDNNTFDFRYTITIHNLGNDTLYNVSVKDSLYEKAVRSPAKYTVRTGPVASGNGQVLVNSNFDGKNDVQLLKPAQSKMPPGAKSSISFVINVVTDSVSVYKNSANGTAINSKNTLVSDTSGNGNNPDVNNNGVWNEPADNLPTVLVVSNPTLFIPQGFSPNGDGINETFVIKGLPDGENELIIYNRWGSKVYESADYDNTWDGAANRGSNGNNKLPQGTYYYVLTLKGTDSKPFTGFIVLQY
ncbi:MAG: gliding motility-associated C-terminal domain-containing protein [Bacteroidia bacterium]|nr:gliding motility-associated C-terminal domain-containing protein [Bacteroidia bacterium]